MFSLKQERTFMTRSKLEFYEDVLKALSNKPLTLDAIAFTGNMDCIVLRKKLDFLLENGLVAEIENCKGKIVYNLTNRGEGVFKTLTLTKRLEKLQADILSASVVEKEPVQAVQGETWKTRHKK
jgi:predicted transcriptional regulator